ncbi:MAG: hydantoinase/oxoprolinase family protein [Rhodospirillales bacterium]|nr:hydantoinase/oxoprolinase family protein [Rhodospirillales bacterium]
MARLAVDIGGTFTDVVLAIGGRQVTTKVLTTPAAPEDGVLAAIEKVLSEAGAVASEIGLVVHGTTLATNALIERKGARTALIVTEGFRDSVEMAYENRFEQYDIGVDRPPPLVPRYLRWPVGERMNGQGEVLRPLDESMVEALLPAIEEHRIESIAVGFLHAYANPVHERRVAEILGDLATDIRVTLSSEVCPEIREYERQSTACANAYVQPLMARYLTLLDRRLRDLGFACPFYLMTSGGGLTTLETAVRFPIRLVESGPAGGAILAGRIAADHGLDKVLSFDMGGTTAKVCLIDDAQPLTSRTFEVARAYRFLKGSGLPIRIPAIEMVEIGAGGGSIARVDPMGRITVGPDSAGADPGPACYGLGGDAATVTDADVALGRIDAGTFTGGEVALDPKRAFVALKTAVGEPLELKEPLDAFAVSELVDENMANAARVHAIEWGKGVAERSLVAFGGAAPLHAARLAEKLGLDTIIVPAGAGVGSAIGFLRAPIAYEVVQSRYLRLAEFDPDLANRIHLEMVDEARAIVRRAAPEAELSESRTAYMRYAGQGHEIAAALPVRDFRKGDGAVLHRIFEDTYAHLYGRTIPGLDVEVLSWTLTVSAPAVDWEAVAEVAAGGPDLKPRRQRRMFDPVEERSVEAPEYARRDLVPGVTVEGPASIVEEQTTTVVSSSFDAAVDGFGHIILTRRRPERKESTP